MGTKQQDKTGTARTMARVLFFGLVLAGAAAAPDSRMQTESAGFVKTECRDSVFWVGLDKHFLAGKLWQINVVDQSGYIVPVTPRFASQCGYTIAVDHQNIEFRASILSCGVHILNDEQFNLTVQIQVSGTDMSASTYIETLSCMYSPWAGREVFCEENYMQVSVQRNIPTIEEDYAQDAEDWALAFPEAVDAESGMWQVVFHTSSGKKTMTVKEAHQLNYGINTTDSRILFRAPYHTKEAEVVSVHGIPLSVIRSTSFYRQQWMILLIDTAVACPLDGISFSDDLIIWTLPRIFTPIVTSTVHQDNSSMGVNGIKLDPERMAERNYSLNKNDTSLAIKVPIGAQDGYYKSHVVDGQYGIKYSINLFLEHLWKDDTWELNKMNIIHPVTTPFIPKPLVLTDDTIPEQWLFNVSLGNFLPDVELQKVTLGSLSFPVDEQNQLFDVYNGTTPNETTLNKIFVLEVPMESPVVDRKYIGDGVEQYTLDIIYTLAVVPEDEIFTYVAQLIHKHDIVLPVANGFCDEENMTLVITHGTLDQYWIPFIGNVQLSLHKHDGYIMRENGTHLTVTVPRDAAGVVHEAIDHQGIRSRFDFQLKDNKSLEVLMNFSVSCSFSTTDFITCFPNGRMVITAMNLGTQLGMDTNKLMLKDPTCKAKESEFQAVFEFSAESCGTTRRFEKDYMIYENEVAYMGAKSTEEPTYRLAISCRYPINDSVHLQFEHQLNPLPVVVPGFGPIILDMQLAKDKSYATLYKEDEYPVVKYLADPLYFEVQLLHNEDPQIELFLQSCWATGSPERDGIPQWPIIVQSCEYEADPRMTIFHPVLRNERVRYPSHMKRFEVETFAFTLGDLNILLGEVYFHCSVVLCKKDPINKLLCPGKCVPRKQRMGRSVDGEHHLEGSVSSGAVLILAELPTVENEMRDIQMESYSWPVLLIGGVTTIVCFIVIGIVGCRYHKQFVHNWIYSRLKLYGCTRLKGNHGRLVVVPRALCYRMGSLLRLALVWTLFITNVWMQSSPPQGLLQSHCYGRLFWIQLNASFLQDKWWSLSVADSTGEVHLLTQSLANECGYTVSQDPFGNVLLRASVLACMVVNEGDDLFRLNLQIRIAAIGHMEKASTYLHTMTCSYFPWLAREILCEQNYMEVSVQRIIPGIENDYNEDWMAVVPSAQEAENAIWQAVFHLPEGTKTMTVNEILSTHYKIGTTVSRLLLRAPYNATEIEQLMVENVPVSSIRSTTFYKQEWMIFLIDTTVACPTDGTTFTENKINWRIPRIIPSLSSQEEQFYDDSIVLGVDGVVLNPDRIAELNYTLTYNDTNILVTIPIGAEGGYYKSHVIEGQYGILYLIKLSAEHQWELTKYTIIHPVATPFMPRPPIVTNNTIPEKRTFNVSVGNFLPDVDLVALTIGTQTVTVDQADKVGITIYETTLPNNTKVYVVEVPFENENVKQEHLHSNVRNYIFDVIYVFNISPENETFNYPVKIMEELPDIVLPRATGFCDEKTLYLLVTQGNLVHYWLPFIDQMLVTQKSARDYGYLLVDNTTHILIGAPLSGRSVIYEELSLHGIIARLNLTLKDKNTMKIEMPFSVVCNFPPADLAVCFPNGTMVITALVDTLPELDPSKMVLKDGKCQPKEVDHRRALFEFSIDSCGTTRTIRGNHLIYENEVSYPREVIPINFPVITRDPDYRLTVLCQYELNDTLSVGIVKRYQKDAQYPGNSVQIVRGGKGKSKKPRHTPELHSRIYKTADYLDFYKDEEYPVAMNWTHALYFEVELMNNKDHQTDLLLDHCWMTTTPDHNGLPQWHFIQAGCENKEEMFVAAFHSISNTIQHSHQLKRFEVKIQELSPAEQTVLPKKVYGHCSVIICRNNPDTNSSCNEQCTMEKGQSTYLDMHKEDVSLGEVWLSAGMLEQAKIGSGLIQSYWQWVLGSSLAIFLILVVVLVKVHVHH
ncbi:zona pellucida protein AX 1 [Pristis pectinata]|uniref:zona pellucida protein AX 1 n=1 Tax=Pristis pectinata TaxID=685728 RepID=UPI00223DF8D0|nr:zona pellucida protein AX 1 [Pristis pectinata]